MIGGFPMKKYLQSKFALTEQGALDLLKACIAVFFMYVINMAPVILLMMFLDQLLGYATRGNSIYFGISIAILLVMYILLNIEYNAMYNTTYKESENLRIDIARNLSNLPLSYFSKHDLSDLAQTIMGDVAGLEHALSHAVAKTIGFMGFFVVMTLMLLKGNFILGLCVVLPIVIYFMCMLLSKKIQIINNKKYYDKLRVNSENFQETIELQQEIKSFGMAEDVKENLYFEVEDVEKIHIKAEFSTVAVVALSNMILYSALIVVIIVGAKLLANGEINILYFLGYLLAAMKIKEASEGIGMNMAELFYINSMIERINEIRSAKIQEGKDFKLSTYDIELKNVSFGYDDENMILKNINFVAKQNEVTALIGKSGCGKTSLLKLVSRLYDTTNGEIHISGKNIRDISTKSLFENISIVFQDVTLFNTSVIENIRIGNLKATDQQVKEAARLANCESFICKLKNGYDTLIGENGASLSGGERQRISIARAFLKNSPIIILDEIAASLDVDNENEIQESLNKLTKGKTVLIISHRLKSIENVDKIVVLDNGEVESIGKHNDLVKASKVYRDLVNKTSLAESFKY